MNASEVAKWITDARFEPYLAETHGDYDGALALYVWNTRIAAAAFETLHHVEVLVRNSVDVQFTPVDPSARPEDTFGVRTSIAHSPLARVTAQRSRR